MKKLLKTKSVIIALIILVFIFGGLVIAWQGALYTLNHISIKDITPTQMAAEMRQDKFWSSNRFNTLVFDGKVKSIHTYGSKITLNFLTSDSYTVSCELSNSGAQFKVRETYKFAAEPYQAERQSNGVLLHNCLSF